MYIPCNPRFDPTKPKSELRIRWYYSVLIEIGVVPEVWYTRNSFKKYFLEKFNEIIVAKGHKKALNINHSLFKLGIIQRIKINTPEESWMLVCLKDYFRIEESHKNKYLDIDLKSKRKMRSVLLKRPRERRIMLRNFTFRFLARMFEIVLNKPNEVRSEEFYKILKNLDNDPEYMWKKYLIDSEKKKKGMARLIPRMRSKKTSKFAFTKEIRTMKDPIPKYLLNLPRDY